MVTIISMPFLIIKNIRRQLSSYLRYVQYCGGRTVIKVNNELQLILFTSGLSTHHVSDHIFMLKERYESNVLYFILSGEVTVSQMKWNVRALKSENITVSVLGPGEMFGHLGLISEELRTSSYETASEYG